MSVVVSSGLEVHYDDLGHGEPALMLMPGWNCNRTMMAPIAERLAEHHRVLNVDLRGQGDSDLSPSYRSDDVVDDLLAVADQAEIAKPVVVGHSLGAKFALAYAIRHPERVAAVILLDTSIVETAERKRLRMAEVEAGADPDGRRRRIASMFLDTDDAQVREQVIESMLGVPREVGRTALVAGDMVDTATGLRECSVPVAYIAAARPGESIELMRELRPDLDYHQIATSGHFIQMLAPDEVVAIIENFLAGQVAAT